MWGNTMKRTKTVDDPVRGLFKTRFMMSQLVFLFGVMLCTNLGYLTSFFH